MKNLFTRPRVFVFCTVIGALVLVSMLALTKKPVQAQTTSIDIRRLETQTRRLERTINKLQQSVRSLEKELDSRVKYRDPIALKSTHLQGAPTSGEWVRHFDGVLELSSKPARGNMPYDAYFSLHRIIEVK